MYANFYDKKDKCLFSCRVSDDMNPANERKAGHLADRIYQQHPEVADWTITEKPMSKETRE